MAQFYAEIQGNRGEAFRMGTKDSGMRAHVRGWNVGVKVSCRYDAENDRDVITIEETGGSNNASAVRGGFSHVITG